nr:hypothetical protein Iba_chr10eCG7730 [Ipomoea batatas]
MDQVLQLGGAILESPMFGYVFVETISRFLLRGQIKIQGEGIWYAPTKRALGSTASSTSKEPMPLSSIKFETNASISKSANSWSEISPSIPAGCASLGLDV